MASFLFSEPTNTEGSEEKLPRGGLFNKLLETGDSRGRQPTDSSREADCRDASISVSRTRPPNRGKGLSQLAALLLRSRPRRTTTVA